MSQVRRQLTRCSLRILILGVALSWVAADASAQGRARSSRSSTSTSSSSSSSSGSSSTSSAPQSSGSSSSRSAVGRSSGSSRSKATTRNQAQPRGGGLGSSGAARTRTNRGGDRPDHRRPGGHHGHSGYWYPYTGYWGWGYGLSYGYGYGYGHRYGYGPTVVYSTQRGYRMGAVDLKIRPKNTEVYVDGQYVGLAKQYDGFPGHLWLESGVHEIAFYRPGFGTEYRTVRILTDLILDVEVAMQPGEAIQPQLELAPPPVEPEDDEVAGRVIGGDSEQGRLHLAIYPGNARVYLDGRMLGTGEELAGLHAGLVLSTGTHTLEVIRDGFQSAERQIVVDTGEDVEFNLALKPIGHGAG